MSVVWTGSQKGFQDLIDAGINAVWEPHATTPPIVQEEESVGVLSDIYDVVDTSLGGVLPGGVPFGSPSPAAQVLTTAFAPQAQLPAPAAAPTVVTQPSDIRGMCYKNVNGEWKWVKPKRRRRKRLATKSDLSDLAALKGILGQGKAFEVWIATHS